MKRLLFLLSIFILLIIIYIFSSQGVVKWLEIFELKTLDFRYSIRGLTKPSTDVCIVSINEDSLNYIYDKFNDSWPISRTWYAKLLKKLYNSGAKSVAFDVSFTTQSNDKKGDKEFAQALSNYPIAVLGTYLISKNDYRTFSNQIKDRIQENLDYLQYQYSYKLKDLSQGIPSSVVPDDVFTTYKVYPVYSDFSEDSWVAHFEIGMPDVDGIFRNIALATKEEFAAKVLGSETTLLPPLSFLATVKYLGYDMGDYWIDPYTQTFGIGDMDNPKIKIKTDKNYIFSLNFYGPDVFPTYSLKNVLYSYSDKQLKKYFSNKLVFVGYTASAKGIYDMRPNPLSANAPGVLIHATAASNFLQGISMERFQYKTFWVFGVIALVLIINILVSKPSFLAMLFIVSLVSYFVLVQFYFNKGIWLEDFYPTVSMIALFSFNIFYLGIKELKEKNKTKSFFQRFVPEDVVKKILKDGVTLGGEKKTITVLFSDIVSFTSLSEKLKPEQVVNILNRHLTNCVEAIMENKGTLDKFIGDAILAFYGAPVEYGDEPLRAIKSALKMVEYGEQLAEQLHREGFAFDFAFGIGIHYGSAVIGNIGSPVRMDYTCIGDAVNTASRIEGLTRKLKRKILISQEVFEQVKGNIIYEDMGLHKVKGKENLVHIYSVEGLKRS